MFRQRKGQSTLEYVLVLTAIIAAIILTAQKFVKPSVEKSVEHVSGQMQTQVEKINFTPTD